MAKCKCKYYLRNKAGQLVCSVCGKPANDEELIEDKQEDEHETKEG